MDYLSVRPALMIRLQYEGIGRWDRRSTQGKGAGERAMALTSGRMLRLCACTKDGGRKTSTTSFSPARCSLSSSGDPHLPATLLQRIQREQLLSRDSDFILHQLPAQDPARPGPTPAPDSCANSASNTVPTRICSEGIGIGVGSSGVNGSRPRPMNPNFLPSGASSLERNPIGLARAGRGTGHAPQSWSDRNPTRRPRYSFTLPWSTRCDPARTQYSQMSLSGPAAGATPGSCDSADPPTAVSRLECSPSPSPPYPRRRGGGTRNEAITPSVSRGSYETQLPTASAGAGAEWAPVDTAQRRPPLPQSSSHIADIPLHYAIATSAGCRRGGRAKENQDAWLVRPRLMGLRHVHVFAVMDGHGRDGAKVSAFVRDKLVNFLAERFARLPEDSLLFQQRRQISGPELHNKAAEVAAALRDSCRGVQAALGACSDIDAATSGTTLTLALLVGRLLITCNVGDSRIVLGSRIVGREAVCAANADAETRPQGEDAAAPAPGSCSYSNARPRRGDTDSAAEMGRPSESERGDACRFRGMSARALTVDQVPAIGAERRRIERCGGRVSRLFHAGLGRHVGPYRVMNPRIGGQRPGLAVSRSIGDRVATEVGVICDPVITYCFLRNAMDKWLVLASDGLWACMFEAEVVHCLEAHDRPVDGAVAVCKAAQQRWLACGAARGSPAVDDITAIVLRLWTHRG